jgi:hypothetical protein
VLSKEPLGKLEEMMSKSFISIEGSSVRFANEENVRIRASNNFIFYFILGK